MPARIERIKVSQIVFDPAFQVRAEGRDADHVSELREAYLARLILPRPRGFRRKAQLACIKDQVVCIDGGHRVQAAIEAGLEEIECEVIDFADDDEARLDAASSNKGHGLRRSNKDKRLAVKVALTARPDWTDSAIADHCGVAHTLVGDVRGELAAVAAAEECHSGDDNCVEHKIDDVVAPDREVQTATPRTSRGRPSQKSELSARAARLLKADPSRKDDEIASDVGCKISLVEKTRHALVEERLIPAVPPPKTAGDPSAPASESRDDPGGRHEHVASSAVVGRSRDAAKSTIDALVRHLHLIQADLSGLMADEQRAVQIRVVAAAHGTALETDGTLLQHGQYGLVRYGVARYSCRQLDDLLGLAGGLKTMLSREAEALATPSSAAVVAPWETGQELRDATCDVEF